METIKETLWDRTVSLPVEFDVYEGESILPTQNEALKRILESWNVVENAQNAVVNYCIESNPDKRGFIENNDIHKFVKPEKIFIKHDANNRVVALFCDYRFNLEDGLAVVFQDEQLKEIGPQYCIL